MTINKKIENILGIDWGSKYVGLSYCHQDSDVIFPIGYLINDGSIFFELSDLMAIYHIHAIVIGRPNQQKDIQKRIQQFIDNLLHIVGGKKMKIHKVGEDYTSVQAGEIVSNFKKNAAEDTISAMLILERWIKENPK